MSKIFLLYHSTMNCSAHSSYIEWQSEPLRNLAAFVKPKSRDGSYPSLDSYPTRSKPKAEGVNVKRPSIVKRHVNKSPNIPLELYRPTVLHLDQDRPSLLAVCLASRRLNAEGKRVLYRRMDISQNAETAHMLFFTTILKPLALLVEEYRQPNDGFPRYFRKDPLWDLVHHGLKAMVNLKWLSLETLDQASNRRRFVEILRGCAFQLEFFEWYNVSHDEEADFLEFLASQPRLRVLLLPGLKNTSTPIPPAQDSKLYVAIAVWWTPFYPEDGLFHLNGCRTRTNISILSPPYLDPSRK